uniref:Uncharacterized protein n=1 Tax=Alexandrium monilatum TaxID=311494 RepID=A0A7S4WFQ0_9DINO
MANVFRLLRRGKSGRITPRGTGPPGDAEPALGAEEEAPSVELPEDLHSFALLAALADGEQGWAGILLPVVSLNFLFVQLVLLLVICCDTSMPRCTGHSQCQLGQWCAPAYFSFSSHYSVDPGICTDCLEAYAMLNVSQGRPTSHPPTVIWSWLRLETLLARTASAGPEWIAAAADHCNRTDVMPFHCDFVVANRKLISGGSMLVLWMTVAMVAISALEDMNEAALAYVFLLTMLQRKEEPPRCAVLAVFWCNTILRLCVLPCGVAVTTCAVLLTSPPTATSFVMNGLVLTFITSLDDSAAQLLPETLVMRLQAAAQTPLFAAAARQSRDTIRNGCHRILALAVSGIIPLIVVHAEDLLAWPIFNVNYSMGPLCSTIPVCLVRIMFFSSLTVTLLRVTQICLIPSLMTHVLPSWSEPHARAVDLLLAPVFATVAFVFVVIGGLALHTLHL